MQHVVLNSLSRWVSRCRTLANFFADVTHLVIYTRIISAPEELDTFGLTIGQSRGCGKWHFMEAAQ